ncbi:MAG: hypothetical protein ACR2JQ_11105, partial [Mycobacteriales bacterium]
MSLWRRRADRDDGDGKKPDARARWDAAQNMMGPPGSAADQQPAEADAQQPPASGGPWQQPPASGGPWQQPPASGGPWQ